MGYSSPASPESPEGPASPAGPQTSPAGPPDETEIVSGADQLLSTAISNGLSDPFDPAQGGWTAAPLAIDPYSAVGGGDGVNPFIGGQEVDPYTGAPPVNDNPNFFTGGQNVDPASGMQNADSFTGGGSATNPSSILDFSIGSNAVSEVGSISQPVLEVAASEVGSSPQPVPAAVVANAQSGDAPAWVGYVYDNNGAVVAAQYVDSNGTIINVPFDGGPNSFFFRELDLTVPLPGGPPQNPPVTPSIPTSPALDPTTPPTPEQPPPSPPVTPPTPAPPAAETAPAPAQGSQPTTEQLDEENWGAAKAGMWDSAVNMVAGLANLAPRVAANAVLPGIGWYLASRLPEITFDWAKSGPPAPTGDPARDAELMDNYRSGGLLTTVVSLAAPIGAEGMLGSAMSAAGKLPALEGMGMLGGGRLVGPTEQWLAAFGESSEALGPEATNALAPGIEGSLQPELQASLPATNPRLAERLAAWRQYQAAGGRLGLQDWVSRTQGAPWGTGFPSNYGDWARSVESVHGNSALSPQPAYLYARYQVNPPQFLKWGITEDLSSRYTQAALENQELIVATQGGRSEMLELERQLTERMPGPLNLESWTGSLFDEPLP